MCGKGKLWHDFTKVSAGKPVGYETLKFLTVQCGLDPEKLKGELEGRGLKTLLLAGSACSMSSGALYAYDEAALSELLRDRASVLAARNWPVTPEDFIRRIAIDWAEEKTPLFDLIADAFNNKDHPGRTDAVVSMPDKRRNPVRVKDNVAYTEISEITKLTKGKNIMQPDFENRPLRLEFSLVLEAQNPTRLRQSVSDDSLKQAFAIVFEKVVGQLSQSGAATFNCGLQESAERNAAGQAVVSVALRPKDKADEKIISRMVCDF